MSYLNQNQKKAVIEFLNPDNNSLEDIANSTGVTSRTIRRWLKQQEFKQALREATERVRSEAYERLKSGLSSSIDTLMELLESSDDRIRLRSANSILDFNTRILDKERLEERLEVLENQIMGEK